MLRDAFARTLLAAFDKGMGEIPEILVDDGFVLARKTGALVLNLAQIDPVAQHFEKVLLVDRPALAELTSLRLPGLGSPPLDRQLAHNLSRRPMLGIAPEDVAHQVCLRLVDHQLALDDVVPERWRTAHPHPLGLAGRDLVADALARDFALKLCEGQQDVERQPAH